MIPKPKAAMACRGCSGLQRALALASALARVVPPKSVRPFRHRLLADSASSCVWGLVCDLAPVTRPGYKRTRIFLCLVALPHPLFRTGLRGNFLASSPNGKMNQGPGIWDGIGACRSCGQGGQRSSV
ncbi:hypothetical protein BJX64DRAFT_108181 [Aspergillus heterothallicus]